MFGSGLNLRVLFREVIKPLLELSDQYVNFLSVLLSLIFIQQPLDIQVYTQTFFHVLIRQKTLALLTYP